MAINNGDTRIAIVAETQRGLLLQLLLSCWLTTFPDQRSQKLAIPIARTLVKLDVLRRVKLFRDAVQKVRSRAN